MVDPVTAALIGKILVAALAVTLTSAVALGFWDQIMVWTAENLQPFMQKHVPTLAPLVTQVFCKIDYVAVLLRNVVRDAWEKLKKNLLGVVVSYEKKHGTNYFVETLKTYLITPSGDAMEKSTERKKNYDQLPPDVRQRFLESGQMKDFDAYQAQETFVYSL